MEIEHSNDDYGFWIRNEKNPSALAYRVYALPAEAGGFDVYEWCFSPRGSLTFPRKTGNISDPKDITRTLYEKAEHARGVLEKAKELPELVV